MFNNACLSIWQILIQLLILELRLQQKPWWHKWHPSFPSVDKNVPKISVQCLVSICLHTAYSIKHVKNVYLLCFILHIAKNTMLEQNKKKILFPTFKMQNNHLFNDRELHNNCVKINKSRHKLYQLWSMVRKLTLSSSYCLHPIAMRQVTFEWKIKIILFSHLQSKWFN